MQHIALIEKNDGSFCPHCQSAKEALASARLPFTLVPMHPKHIKAIWPKAVTVPVIVIDGEYIGGHSELKYYLETEK